MTEPIWMLSNEEIKARLDDWGGERVTRVEMASFYGQLALLNFFEREIFEWDGAHLKLRENGVDLEYKLLRQEMIPHCGA